MIALAAVPVVFCAQARPLGDPVPTDAVSQVPPAVTPGEPRAAADPQAIADAPSDEMDEITVSTARVPDVPATLDRVEVYDDQFMERSDVFTADSLLQKLPPSLPGTGQTVLIDGRRSTQDPATIPVEMIDRVEVNEEGTMPDGEHVAGNVVNIILKKNYSGSNLNARDASPLSGGGSTQEFAFNAATLDNGLGTSITVTHRVTGGLTANERDFSSEQDHTAEGGRDFDLPWGYPAVVQAVSGNLNGVVTAKGVPVATALVPAAMSATRTGGALTPANFIPGPAGVTDATGLRGFNTAADLYLQAPSVTDALNLSFSRALADSMRFEARYGLSHSESQNLLAPPVTPVSAASMVPAAYNPFGQPVEVGMVNEGFGAIRQYGAATTQNAEFSLGNLSPGRWDWSAHTMLGHSSSEQSNPELDPALFSAALASPNAALRFDPLISDAPGTHNAGLYRALTSSDVNHASAQQASLGFDTHGKPAECWAGPARLALATEYAFNQNSQNSTGTNAAASSLRANAGHASGNVDCPVFSLHHASSSSATLTLHGDVTQVTQHSESTAGGGPPQTKVVASSVNSSVRVPWMSPSESRPGLYRLETDLGVGRATSTSSATASTQNGVLLWMPQQSITLRVSGATQQIAPPLTLAPLSVSYDQTLIDPLRNIPTATGVEVVSGVPAGLTAAVNHERTVSIDVAPTTVKGLRAELHYTEQNLRNPVRSLSAQDVVDNAAALPGYLTRLAPSALDLSLGQPGPITVVNVTPFNGGAVHTRALDYVVNYSGTTAPLDTLAVNARARHMLESDNDLLAGVPMVSSSDQNAPPDWTYTGQVNWKRGTWDFDTEYSRTGSGHYGLLPYAAYTSVNVRVSHRFAPLGKRSAKGPQIGLGIANVFNASPPYVDTLTGFRGGSPLGRVAELTLRMPFSS